MDEDVRSYCPAHEMLLDALVAMRRLVQEGGVPRYTVIPGAALNSVIEELVDPALKIAGAWHRVVGD